MGTRNFRDLLLATVVATEFAGDFTSEVSESVDSTSQSPEVLAYGARSVEEIDREGVGSREARFIAVGAVAPAWNWRDAPSVCGAALDKALGDSLLPAICDRSNSESERSISED